MDNLHSFYYMLSLKPKHSTSHSSMAINLSRRSSQENLSSRSGQNKDKLSCSYFMQMKTFLYTFYNNLDQRIFIIVFRATEIIKKKATASHIKDDMLLLDSLTVRFHVIQY